LIQGSLLGLSDDEAYYWVLAQRPAWGYAYHPPAVAWLIAFFQWLFGKGFGTATAGLVRLPAALGTMLILGMGFHWLKRLGLRSEFSGRALGVMLSFAGFFSLAWMMVPDIPLFLGWMILFNATWSVCFEKKWGYSSGFLLLGSCLLLLSKYSGILAIFSSWMCIFLWAPSERKVRSIFFLALGCLAAAIPIFSWNATHQWASVLYQLRDRHQGSQVSMLRYGKFWLAEMILAGPILIFYFFNFLGRACSPKVWKVALVRATDRGGLVVPYLSVWILPAAGVFCIQPLFSDFKLHWAFIVWLPVFLGLAWESQGKAWKWIKIQVVYGFFLGGVVLLSCHVPLGTLWMNYRWPEHFDPRLDVTNDLYGWNQLGEFMRSQWGDEIFRLPVIGSRYQTAAQASFSLNQRASVTLLPRDIKERDEWPDLGISDSQGPGWPALVKSVLYVSDNRYEGAPGFQNADCSKIGKMEKKRADLLIKWIDIWRCVPR